MDSFTQTVDKIFCLLNLIRNPCMSEISHLIKNTPLYTDNNVKILKVSIIDKVTNIMIPINFIYNLSS